MKLSEYLSNGGSEKAATFSIEINKLDDIVIGEWIEADYSRFRFI